MVRLPRYFPSVAIACCLTVPVLSVVPTWAQEATNQTAAAAPDQALKTAVENFWHYGKIARYDLAVNQAGEILQHKDQPEAILSAFEQVAAARNDDLDTWMLRWQGVEPMRDVTNQLINVLADGYRARRSSPAFIQQNIERLIVNERAYTLAVGRLRESGELAVPLMLDYLRDSTRSGYHSAIRRALRDLGKQALNPLVAATTMQDPATLAVVASVLGEIGYQASVPYLAELAQSSKEPEAVKQAATNALRQMGAGDVATIDTAQRFYDLAERFYYASADIQADARNPQAFVWYWDTAKGLYKKDVPPQIFNDIQAMRASAKALSLNPSLSNAVSLWLAADYKREADLPAGATDLTRAENEPDAHYYGVAAGTRYLSPVLARALRDHNSAVALRALKSLEEIVGHSNLFSGEGQPVVDALQYPDRLVRFEAAMTLASALPQQAFTGSDQVVPILSEALLQTGRPQVVVIDASQDTVNKLVEGLKAQFGVAGATSAQGAAEAADKLPTVDAVVVNGAVGAGEVDALRAMMNQAPKMRSAVLVILTQTQASDFEALTVNNPMVMTSLAKDAAGLAPAIEEARSRGMSLPVDEALATQYALRSAALLQRLAVARNEVLNPVDAQPALLQTLSDSRAELVKAAGQALAMINTPQAQRGLLAGALAQATPQDVKVSLYKSVATNAKFFGNQLEQKQIDELQQVVMGDGELAIRSSAAEVRGALNLPTDEAAQLILGSPSAK